MTQQYKPFAIAALYAATVVGVGMFFKYGGGAYGLGQIAGVIAFAVTAILALMFSPFFYLARRALSSQFYFLIHLAIGLAIGGALAARNPYVVEVHQYVFNNDGILAICASMAAWMYIILTVPPRHTADQSSPSTYRENKTIALVVGIVMLADPIVLAPKPTDPSCHNTLRNGRMSARPSINISMTVNESEISTLTGIYEQFAVDYGLSIRGHALLPDTVPRSLCNEDVTISAGGVSRDRLHHMGFYQSEDGSGWEPMTSDLICRLESVWADKVIFRGGGGEEISKPTIVASECTDNPVR